MLYCPLSGLCPLLIEHLGVLLHGPALNYPLVSDALWDMAPDQIEMTLIGPNSTDGVGKLSPSVGETLSQDEILLIPDANIHVVPLDIDWTREVDWARIIDGTKHQFSPGPNIMVASAALSILSLATNGRMNPQRIWRMAMYHGRLSEGVIWCSFEKIDYGEIENGRDFYPQVTPGFDLGVWVDEDEEFMIELEGSDDSDIIRQKIMWEGKSWVWMSPDCFPVDSTLLFHSMIPTLLEPPSCLHALSRIEQLPSETLIEIASRCPLLALLCLFSTSRHIRSKHLAFPSDRDHIACSWIKMSAPWYIPEEDLDPSRTRSKKMGWTYLQNCIDSGSMRNRKRIWDIATQLEEKADEMGI